VRQAQAARRARAEQELRRTTAQRVALEQEMSGLQHALADAEVRARAMIMGSSIIRN
jgi:hypothetical protein